MTGDDQRAEALLHAVPLLGEMSASVARRLVVSARAVEVPSGTVLVSEGDPATGMYLVLSGRLRVQDRSGRLLRVLRAGDVVGELSLLTEGTRTATVSAVRDTRALFVPRAVFLELLHSEPRLLRSLLARLAGQLAEGVTDVQGGGRFGVLAVVHLDVQDDDVDVALRQGLRGVRTVGPDGPESGWAAVVEDAEDDGGALLLCPPAASTSWRRFALRTADRVVVVGSRDAHAPSDLRGCDTVAVRVPSGAPWPTWAARLEPRRRHRLEDPASLPSLVRRLAGRSPGAVLSGGGARAMAHLGVLAGLEAEGLRPERWGGCSMGAFVAALAAEGRSAAEITSVCRRELVMRHPFRDVVLPRHAVSSGRRLQDMLDRVFGSRRLEDLREDFFCVTADLVSGALVVHRSGLLRELVAASMAIPALAPPLRRDGMVLVDGGVLDNLPVAAMHASGEGPVLAVDVARRSGAALADAAPSLFDTVCQALTIGGRQQVKENLALADVVLTPAVGRTGLLDFSRLDECAAAGQAAVRASRDALRALAGP